MHDSVALPAVPTLPALPPIPAPDAPPEHHARWLIEAVHVIRTIAHDGVLIVENPIVQAFLSPEMRDICAVIAVADTVVEANANGSPATPAAAAVAAPSADPSTPSGAPS